MLLRPIHLVKMPEGKTRPAVLLTREHVRGRVAEWTVAPITSTVRGLKVEVAVGAENGLDHASVINCDNITTVGRHHVGRCIGRLTMHQEGALAQAIGLAFDLEPVPI